MTALLSLVEVTRRFGGVAALEAVSFDVAGGEIMHVMQVSSRWWRSVAG
jgi:ABC-type branched-subunit amino acid transport system ATPase component